MWRIIGVLLGCQGAMAAPIERPPVERLEDGAGVVLLTAGLSAVGVGMGYLVGDESCSSPDAGSFCIPSNVVLMAVLGSAGFIAGPSMYDRWTDGDGSLLGAWLGFLGGGLVAGPIIGQFTADLWDDDEEGKIMTAGILATLGLGLGYSAFEPLNAAPTVMALSDGEGNHRHGLGMVGRF